MTPAKAKALAKAAGYVCYWDYSLRMYACYHEERNARGEEGSEARYFTKDTLANMTPALFTERFLGE